MKTKIITKEEISLAVNALKAEKTIAFKTDTIYGLSCLSTSKSACERLAQIKGREGKPLILLVSKDMNIEEYVESIPAQAQKVIDKFWPGPLTIIFKAKYPFCETITCNKPTIAIRMPNDALCERLISAVGKPIVSTSANLSGEEPLDAPDAIFKTFKGKLPYIIDSGKSVSSTSSTIIAIDGDNISVLREGIIKKEDIESVIF